MIQIRNVPEGIHRELKARAAHAGTTLSAYLLAEVERLVALPSEQEMLARLRRRRPVTLRKPAAAYIREERESR